jgi:AcrR family transcriptional regulator
VLRTRHLLLQAFSDLYSAKGFHAMTVQDITDRARVNRGNFYSHFEDKSAILEGWLREQFQQRVASPVLSSGPGASAPSACSFGASLNGSRSYTIRPDQLSGR